MGVMARVEEVIIPPFGLRGMLLVPTAATGLVLFAHGSGSSRFSPRNNYVADALREAGLGTLLFDLLRDDEGHQRAKVFDIPLLAERLVSATEWVVGQPGIARLPIGYFGASTGSAAALIAATEGRVPIAAVVSRGGRPDLAANALPHVTAPTLLIVGGADFQVLGLNQAALGRMRCEKRLAVVPGATHLFEEEGALDEVIDLARAWFLDHLVPPASSKGDAVTP